MARRASSDSSGRGPGRVTAEVASFEFSQVLTIADALPMAITYVDTSLKYRFANKAHSELLGRPRSEYIGKGMAEILPAEVMDARRPMLEAALEGERQWFAADYPHPDRGTLATQSEYLPQTGPDGRVTGLIIVIQDVTEQRVAERALRESEARFRRIADSAPVMMWVTRLDRTRDFVNDAYMAFTGLSREEAQALDWRTRIHPDDVDRIVAESIAGEASRKMFTLEGRYLRHDSEWRC